MKTYKAQLSDRLDQIVYKEYGTLQQKVFEAVMLANPKLKNKVVLDEGDIIYLPVVEIEVQTIKEVKSLW